MVLDINVIAFNECNFKKLRVIIKLSILVITVLNEICSFNKILISHHIKRFQNRWFFFLNAFMIGFSSLGSSAVKFDVM
jgi:hypothetical protein